MFKSRKKSPQDPMQAEFNRQRRKEQGSEILLHIAGAIIFVGLIVFLIAH